MDRVYINNVVDGLQHREGNITLNGCLVEGMTRVSDPNQGDGWAHCDGGQLQGGGCGLTILGTLIDLEIDPYFSQSRTCLLFTSDVGTPCGVISINKSWFKGGSIPLNFATDPSSVSITNVKIKKGQQYYGQSPNYFHIIALTSLQAAWTLTKVTDWESGDIMDWDTGDAVDVLNG
jgi:hypothetical protein